MSWGKDLWDQFDNVADYTEKGIDFLEKYGNFIDHRCKIEIDYASKLRRLIKSYFPKKSKIGQNCDDESQFTYTKAYINLLNELGDQAGQHEMIAENLSNSVLAELVTLVKQLRDNRKRYLFEGTRLQENLQSSLSLLVKSRERYKKAFSASERAIEAYKKADLDFHLSRNEVERHKMNSIMKSQQCDDAKNDYACQLLKTNESQAKFYNQSLPSVFQNLRENDEKRINCVKSTIIKSVMVERDVAPIVSQCFDGMLKGAESIDVEMDSRLVVERYKSGFEPPEDLPFEDLSSAVVGDNSRNSCEEGASLNGSAVSILGQSSSIVSEAKKSILGTITGSGRSKKRSGFLGLFSNQKNFSLNEKDDFSDLPPNQRRKKLQQKIDEISSKVCQEKAARDGLMKMKQVYESNHTLGDPMSIQGQLTENAYRMEKLNAELKKIQGYFDELDGRNRGGPAIMLPSVVPGENVADGGNHRMTIQKSNEGLRNSLTNSDEADSLTRSISEESSVSNNRNDSKPHSGSEPIRKVTCRILSPLTRKRDKDAGNASSNNVIKSPNVSSCSTSSNSPESGIATLSSTTSIPNCQGETFSVVERANQAIEQDNTPDEFIDAEFLPILGRCKSLYAFEVTSEGSIRMDEGEHLWVIETDQGDGWTRVRRLVISPNDQMPEGFVPSTYIDIYEMFSVPRPV